MEILFYQYGSICEPDIIACFQSLGLSVICEKTELSNKKLLPSERVQNLSALFDRHHFTFVFSVNFYPSISDICQIYHIPYVCWSVDCPIMELFSNSIKNDCNRIFCFDKAQYDAIARYNPNGIFHLPLCTNVSRWDDVCKQITAQDHAKYSSDISFIGSLYTEKDPYILPAQDGRTPKTALTDVQRGFIDGIIAATEQLYGYNLIEQTIDSNLIDAFKAILPDFFYSEETTVFNTDTYVAAHRIIGMHASSEERLHLLSALGDHFDVDLYTHSDVSPFASISGIHPKGGAKTLTEMPKIFHLSKINLNITMRPIQSGLSLRIWDVLGSGGFLMCNYQPELFDYFIPGEDLEVFSSKEELLAKCDYYLAHDADRERIARNGYEKVKQLHTYEHRIAEMIKIIYNTLQ